MKQQLLELDLMRHHVDVARLSVDMAAALAVDLRQAQKPAQGEVSIARSDIGAAIVTPQVADLSA